MNNSVPREVLDFFDPKDYLICNPDLIEHFVNLEALTNHFINHGYQEGRVTSFDESPRNRWDYKNVWNNVTNNIGDAMNGVAGYTDEEKFNFSAQRSVEKILESFLVNKDHSVLEIGAGIGRVGKVLSSYCKDWTGCDASSQMVKFATDYLKDIDNAKVLETSGYDLRTFQNETFDFAYCVVVFMHIDEWERYNYIKESFRVLKRKGQLLVNNINLCSKEGWEIFVNHCSIQPSKRPLNISKTSTSCEIVQYFEKSGFVDIVISQPVDSVWLTVKGTKP